MDKPEPELVLGLNEWAKARGVSHIIWTALPAKFKTDERMPSVDEVVQHLSDLKGTQRDTAEQYVRNTPRQIDTQYRRCIESKLHWTASIE